MGEVPAYLCDKPGRQLVENDIQGSNYWAKPGQKINVTFCNSQLTLARAIQLTAEKKGSFPPYILLLLGHHKILDEKVTID